MGEISVHAFNGLNGRHICRFQTNAASWSDSINEAGSISATVSERGVPETALRPYGAVVAALLDGRVLHAGYVTHARRNRAAGTYTVEGGGGLTVLEKRLVLNHNLDGSWRDGTVVIDEEHPPGNWTLTAKGSYSDIIRALIVETKKWGDLPIDAAAATGGNKTKTWECWSMATVADRMEDIGNLVAGPEYRLDPYLTGDVLRFRQRTSTDGGELVDHRWYWSATAPGSGVTEGDEDRDGEIMASQCYATGGRDEDKLLVARNVGTALTNKGWPVLQVANTQHSDVSILATLQSYAAADVRNGDGPQLSVAVGCSVDHDVRVGDWLDLRVAPGTDGVLYLKVCDVSGDTSGRLQLGCRER